jgi:hypothetical protein
MNIRPPNVEDSWDKCNVWIQAMLIAYSQIRGIEEQENLAQLLQILFGSK